MQYPKKIQIGFQEGTCPLRCKKCPAFGDYVKKEKITEKMSLETAKKLVDEISQLDKIPVIQPHIVTEPFANQDLKEIIPYCYGKSIPFSIITNGILLDEVWIDLLVNCLDRRSTVSFSLDAVMQETYEKVRGTYSLANIEQCIENIIHHRGNKGPRISVNFVCEEENYHERENFLNRWKNKVDAVHIGVVLDEYKKIPEFFRRKDIKQRSGVCPFLQEVMVIDSDGSVRVCSADAFGVTYLGNAFEEGILEVWNGERRTQLMKQHEQNQLRDKNFCFECEWGHSLYCFDKIEETEEYIIKMADYAMYYNRKEKL